MGGGLKPPGGGAPPPTHSWRICDRFFVLAGVLGVLGLEALLGILAQNPEKIIPEPSPMEPRGLQKRVRSRKIEPGTLQYAILEDF